MLETHSKLTSESEIAFNDVVHIGYAMANHQRSLKTHSKCET
jgi:hypothetical protein